MDGAVTRIPTTTKNPMRAIVTATMAAIRAAPSALTNSTNPFTRGLPLATRLAPPGKFCPVYG